MGEGLSVFSQYKLLVIQEVAVLSQSALEMLVSSGIHSSTQENINYLFHRGKQSVNSSCVLMP